MIRKYLSGWAFALLALISGAGVTATIANADVRVTIKYAHCCPAEQDRKSVV